MLAEVSGGSGSQGDRDAVETPICPICRERSGLSKVSAIALGEAPTQSAPAPEAASSGLYQADTARFFRQPSMPTVSFRASFMVPCLLFTIGLMAASFVAIDIGGNLFLIDRLIGSNYPLQDLLSEMLRVPNMSRAIVVGIFAVVLFTQSIMIGMKEEQMIRGRYQKYQLAMDRWERSYYCARDDAAFVAEESWPRPPEQFGNLLWR